MRRRSNRTKPIETLKKKTDLQFPDPSSSRSESDLKRRRKVSFNDAVDYESGFTCNESIDAKTSEFAFFKKLKSGFGLSSESSNAKPSNQVKQIPKTFELRSKPQGTDREAKDGCKSYNFSTPMQSTRGGGGSCGLSMSHANITQRGKEKDSSAFTRDKDANTSRSGGIVDEKGDLFSVKRKRLHQWVKDTWFPEIPEVTSNGHDLVSVLLTRLLPGTEETHPSRFPKERTDRAKRRTFLDSPGTKLLKRSHERYLEVDDSLQMEWDRPISRRGWLDNRPSLQFATDHLYSSIIPRDPEENDFSISYPERSGYRPLWLKQKASSSFPVEEAPEYSPIPSLHFRNYTPLSLDYHVEESGYSSEDLSHDHREPSSALLLEWNNETIHTRNTDDLHLSYDTKLITYPNATSSSYNPWSSDYYSSHDLVTRELYPLPLLSDYTSDSFLLPTTSPTSYFEHEDERHIIDDEDMGAANLNLQTFHRTSSSDCLTRDYTYYQPLDHCHSKAPGCDIVSFPFSSIGDLNLVEASSPTRSDCYKSHDWIPFKFQSPQAWIDS